MKPFYFSFVIFSLLCVTACQFHKANVEDNSIMIDWDNASISGFNIENVEYIPLETTDSSLLGSVDKILFRNNCFYVLDKMSGGIYVFDRRGNFISSVMKHGEGPDEYIELMDMDVDTGGNIYVADNARMIIHKYRFPEWQLDRTYDVGKHYWEFCCLDEDCFILKDIFGNKGLEMKLAHFDSKNQTVTSIIERKYSSIDEMGIMKCSKFNLYRSGNHIYYNERFTPNVYSISSEGKLTKAYTITSSNYISEEELKGLQNEPVKFLMEKKYIKDIIGLYENEDYFVCMPFIKPSGTCLVTPKNESLLPQKIELNQSPYFLGASLIEGTADGKFFSILNVPNDRALESDSRLCNIGEDANPILMLFSLNVKSEE